MEPSRFCTANEEPFLRQLVLSVRQSRFQSLQETTKIQIRFHNGERVAQVFNVDQRVSDIHTYVMTAAPVDGSYVLVSGFPPKPLSDPNVSIKEAGLKGAQITQKLV